MTAKIHETPKRAGGDRRGNPRNRRARKIYLLSPKAGFGGDGTKVGCVFCDAVLDYDTVQADRIEAGGSYRRDNVQPACAPCNKARGNKPVEVFISHVITTTTTTTTMTTTTMTHRAR